MAGCARAETLQDALIAAYQNNPDLHAAEAKLRATDERVPEALSGYRPTLDATAEAGRSATRIGGNDPLTGTTYMNPRQVGVSLSQPLFRGFRTEASVESAEATVKAERASLQETEQKVLQDTAKAYLDVLQADTVLTLSRENETSLKDERQATQVRYELGELKKTDVSQAEARLATATVSRLQAEGDVTNKRATYTRLVGHPPGSLQAPSLSWDMPHSLDDAMAAAGKQSPSVSAATHNVDAARADVIAARGSLLPELSLVGNATRAWDQAVTLREQQDSGTIMARLTIPLYRAGADYARTRAAQQIETQRALELNNARNTMHEQVAEAWQSLQTAVAAMEGHKAAVTANETALEGVREESRAGTRTTLDVLNAEQELVEARINLARAEHDQMLANVQLRAAIGTWTARDLQLPVKLYDPDEHAKASRTMWFGFSSDETR